MESNEHFEIRIIRNSSEFSIESARLLYKEAGWWDTGCTDTWLESLPEKSFLFVGAFVGDRLAGIGRVISDGVSDAYIQDVTVLRPYRRNGIAHAIVAKLVDCLHEAGIDWISLIATAEAVGTYKRLGFCEMQGCTPMHFETQTTATK